MAEYEYRCPVCGARRTVVKPMAEAGQPVACRVCEEAMRRVYDPQAVIIRPRGWNLRPGENDPTVPGLSYSFFDYELERGELRDDATSVYTPESRAKREAELAAEDERERTMAEIDRDIPERAHQELHEWARAVHSRVSEESDR